MAAELDFQAIVDLVGDKLREVFADARTSASAGTIREANLVHIPRTSTSTAKRLHPEPASAKAGRHPFEHDAQTRQPS